jgi:hypothetical protein
MRAAVLYLNNGQGGFTSGAAMLVAGRDVRDLTASYTTDLNSDRKADFVLPYSASGGTDVFVTLSQSASFALPLEVKFIAEQAHGIGDFTGDGVADLLTYRSFNSALELHVYPSDGVGSFAAPLATPTKMSPSQFTISDFNNDGRPDVALAGTVFEGTNLQRALFILQGVGNGRFAQPLELNDFAEISRVFAEDFNNDARTDLLYFNSSQSGFFCG